MAGGGGEADGSRELNHTPTWAVASVCAVIVAISILLEKLLHHIGSFFVKKRKKALLEALQKVQNELMVLGFISLLLTFGQNYIVGICIPLKLANTMLPCGIESLEDESTESEDLPESDSHRRLLLSYLHKGRMLAAGSPSKGCEPGHVPLISVDGLHQLHIFIFFLAVFHVIYSAMTMALGRLKIRRWKEWERECYQAYDTLNDPSRIVLVHQNSFVREHTKIWTRTRFTFYLVCFLRQFVRSVRKKDYLIMRHAFISVHISPGSRFDFRKYIKRSLEDDFKVIVGISPILWAQVVLFLLIDVEGWNAMFWVSILPLIVILAVGTKLQAVITSMALDIKERNSVIQGIPIAQVSDKHFWFEWPQFVLYLIHYTLFQNAFELTYSVWLWYEFGLKSCFYHNQILAFTRVVLGIGVQILCSYITLPLYALVSQMGSNLKRSIFDDQTSKALLTWHRNVVKRRSVNKSGTLSRTLTRTLSMFSVTSDSGEQPQSINQRTKRGRHGHSRTWSQQGLAALDATDKRTANADSTNQTNQEQTKLAAADSSPSTSSNQPAIIDAAVSPPRASLSLQPQGDQARQAPNYQSYPGGQPDFLTGS